MIRYITAGLFFFAAVVIGFVWTTHSQPVTPLKIDTPVSPGQVLPPWMFCNYSGMGEVMYCYNRDQTIYASMKSGVIQSVSYIPKVPFTIGELINTWGKPEGIYKTSLSAEVWWPGRYAYVNTKGNFDPANTVGFIGYLSDSRFQYSPWKGFKNNGTN